jgi:hypothetical protein
MNTSPSIDDILAGVIMAIDDDILPALGNAKAQATAVMMQSLLQGLRQLIPVHDERLVDEHNAMTRVLCEMAEVLGGVDGPAADRVRKRADTLGRRDDLPSPLDRESATSAHHELGCALETSLVDLDELQRAGESSADAALQVLRAHLGARYLRDVETFTVGEGFVGRG